MIIGIGNDLTDIERIKEVFTHEGRLRRIFTDEEVALIMETGIDHIRAAGNFALKEAFSKAIGTGIRGFALRDIEVLRTPLGRPYITEESIRTVIDKAGMQMDGEVRVHCSISHEGSLVMATVIIEGR